MRQYISFDATKIKMVALITMLIDHFAAGVLFCLIVNLGYGEYINIYYACRYIGRLAFPIFCFFIVEGFFHTRDVKRYLLRLLIFALISEVPFDMAIKRCFFEVSHQNVFFTLFLGLVAIYGIDYSYTHFDLFDKRRFPLCAVAFSIPMLLAYFLKTDYSIKGVLIIVLIYLFHGVPVIPQLTGPMVLAIWELADCINNGSKRCYELAAIFAIPLLLLYNGKRGRGMNKFLFYIFYPLHLLIIGIICMTFLD